MSDALITGLISAGVSLFGIIVSLVSIFVSANSTRNDVTHKLDTNQQVMNSEIGHIKTNLECVKEDVKAHNNYAKLFNENIPLLTEKIAVANHRIADIEDDIRFYHRKPKD